MKTDIKTVYSCDHCKKKYFKKHSCEHHEKFCASNPETFPKCNGCIHFEERNKDVWYDSYNGGYERRFKSFFCKKRDCGMYPLKALAKDLPNRFPETFEGEILLPHECEFFEDGSNSFNDLFDLPFGL